MRFSRHFTEDNRAGIVLFLALLVIVALPDNLPFVFADICDSAAVGNAVSLNIACTTCLGEVDLGGSMIVSGCNINNIANKCEFTVTGTLQINGMPNDCFTLWRSQCGGTLCTFVNGPGLGNGTYTFNKTRVCPDTGTTMKLDLLPDATKCNNCSPDSGVFILVSSARCE